MNVEADALDRLDLPIVLTQIAHFDDGIGGTGLKIHGKGSTRESAAYLDRALPL